MKQFNTKKRTKEYIQFIAKGIKYSLEKIGDIVLILHPCNLYIPYIDRRYYRNGVEIGGHVNRTFFNLEKVEHLALTSAEVVGFDFGMDYYNPNSGDLELKCQDGKIRGASTYWGTGNTHVFIPCPELFNEFILNIGNHPSFSQDREREKIHHIDAVKQYLRRYFSEIGF
jgi:hypothetical protein